MGWEIGRIRPTSVFEREGESRMTPPAMSISSQVRPRISLLAPAGIVGECSGFKSLEIQDHKF